MKINILTVLLYLSGLIITGCGNNQPKDGTNENTKDSTSTVETHSTFDATQNIAPEWSKDAVIYEVNMRQFTKEGTIRAFMEHLPRLQELGVDILWLMPMHPISEKNRKGTLGSYYAVQDYQKINPEFGTDEDFKALVDKAHEMGFKIILDWVANHTGWDHWAIEKHPEWYTKDSTGNMQPPVADWTDVADLNYDNPAMRQYMIESLEYWVKNFGVDGYRCDVAGMVPVDFWNDARIALEKINPNVFMLAEAEERKLHDKAFHMGYAWHFHHIMNQIAKGEMGAKEVKEYFEKAKEEYPNNIYRMYFTSNHDENTWNGTVFERMPNSYEMFAAMSFITPGMPLIYSGQEAGLDKRLAFFDKDEIQWKEHQMGNFYKKLIQLKTDNPALWNGNYGGDFNLEVSAYEDMLIMTRTKGDNVVIGYFNITDKQAQIPNNDPTGFVDFGTNEQPENTKNLTLAPWEYRIWVKK